MSQKKIFAYLNAQNETKETILDLAGFYDSNGVDGLFIYNYSKDEKEREEFVLTLRELQDRMDIPFYAGCFVDRLEDVKKIYYAGAEKVVLDPEYMSDTALIRDAIIKFGANSVMMQMNFGMAETVAYLEEYKQTYAELLGLGVYGIMAKHVTINGKFIEKVNEVVCPVMIRDSLQRNSITDLLEVPNLIGVATNYYRE